jgi:hypothetical protein
MKFIKKSELSFLLNKFLHLNLLETEMKDKPKIGMNMKKKPIKKERHEDAKEDKKLVKKMVKKVCMK